MDINSPQLPQMKFKKITSKTNQDQLTMDSGMIRLFIAIDENKTVSQIADELGLSLSGLREALAKLLNLKLIEPIDKRTKPVSKDFLKALGYHLTVAVGPMGSILIDDVLTEMGLTKSNIPVEKAAELVSTLAHEIPEDDNRIQFKKAMIPLLSATTI